MMLASTRIYPIGWYQLSEGHRVACHVTSANIELHDSLSSWRLGPSLPCVSPYVPCPNDSRAGQGMEEESCYSRPSVRAIGGVLRRPSCRPSRNNDPQGGLHCGDFQLPVSSSEIFEFLLMICFAEAQVTRKGEHHGKATLSKTTTYHSSVSWSTIYTISPFPQYRIYSNISASLVLIQRSTIWVLFPHRLFLPKTTRLNTSPHHHHSKVQIHNLQGLVCFSEGIPTALSLLRLSHQWSAP